MEEENKMLYCENCKEKTEHLKCGFGRSGGLSGNGRYRCLKCKKERV